MNPIKPAPTSINKEIPNFGNVITNEVPKVPESSEAPKPISDTPSIDSTLAQDIAAAKAETAQEHLNTANVIKQPIDRVVDNSASDDEDKLLRQISAK